MWLANGNLVWILFLYFISGLELWTIFDTQLESEGGVKYGYGPMVTRLITY